MRIQAEGTVCRTAIALFMTAMLSTLSVGAWAAEQVAPFQTPFKYKRYHVHYDVNADATFKEQRDMEMIVLNEQGVQTARQMQAGMHFGPIPGNVYDQDVEVVAAFTIKKNGEHVAATPVSADQASLFARTIPMGGMTMGLKFLAFQRVEVGDTVVLSYRTTQKKPLIPDNLVLYEIFPKFTEYDDVVISVSAPASRDLRVEAVGGSNVQSKMDAQTRTWTWNCQNKVAASQPNQVLSINQIHVSSFKDSSAEVEAVRKLSGAFLPSVKPPLRTRCDVLPGTPNDGPAAINLYASQVAYFFWSSEDALKQAVSDWTIPTCVLDDGRPRLSALLDGYGDAFERESDWSKSLARVDYLKSRYPNQAFVALAEAEYWISYAWNARGHGFASSVTEEGWKLFRERLEKAEQILVETKSYSADLPIWYSDMINVQSALDRPEDERDRVFLEGVKRFPAFYPTYFTMLNYLSPKWGGTWRTVDNLVKWSVEHTKEAEGDSMYARIYWAAAGDPKVNLFKDTFATWPRMRRGFEDLMARHPKSKWNLNNFAKFACMAGDRQSFLKLRAQIGKDVIDAAWPESASLDLCETKFGYSE